MARFQYGGGAVEPYNFQTTDYKALQKIGIPDACIDELAEQVAFAASYRTAFTNEPQESDKKAKANDLIKSLKNTQEELRRADGYFIAAMQDHAARVYGDSFPDADSLQRLLQCFSNAAFWAAEEISPQRGKRNDAALEAKRLLSGRVLFILKKYKVRVSTTETGTAAQALRVVFAAAGFPLTELQSMERFLKP